MRPRRTMVRICLARGARLLLLPQPLPRAAQSGLSLKPHGRKSPIKRTRTKPFLSTPIGSLQSTRATRLRIKPSVLELAACAASAMWFSGLGFGARLLAPVFERPAAWRVLDGLIGVVMWWIAAGLVWGQLR